MNDDKRIIDGLLEDIQELIEKNKNEDGTFRFDLRIRIALEFAKSTLEKSIQMYQQAGTE